MIESMNRKLVQREKKIEKENEIKNNKLICGEKKKSFEDTSSHDEPGRQL